MRKTVILFVGSLLIMLNTQGQQTENKSTTGKFNKFSIGIFGGVGSTTINANDWTYGEPVMSTTWDYSCNCYPEIYTGKYKEQEESGMNYNGGALLGFNSYLFKYRSLPRFDLDVTAEYTTTFGGPDIYAHTTSSFKFIPAIWIGKILKVFPMYYYFGLKMQELNLGGTTNGSRVFDGPTTEPAWEIKASGFGYGAGLGMNQFFNLENTRKWAIAGTVEVAPLKTVNDNNKFGFYCVNVYGSAPQIKHFRAFLKYSYSNYRVELARKWMPEFKINKFYSHNVSLVLNWVF